MKELWSKLLSVETIQVVLEGPLLRAADRAAKRSKINSLRERRKVPRGQEHLRLIQQEAQEIVGQAFASASGAGGS